MDVEIIVNGQSVDLNDYVKRVTFEINSGLIKSLRDVPDWSTVEIKLTK